MIRPCKPEDAGAICGIYNPHVLGTIVTFEETPVTEEEMARRIAAVGETLPWLVWQEGETIAGYAYASRWKQRSAYRFSVESTVYVAPAFARRGIGACLMETLITEVRSRGAHCIVGGVALPNPASVALHEKLGFTKVAQFKEIGYKLGRWVDVAYWELVLRS